jgi:hypothetical protein
MSDSIKVIQEFPIGTIIVDIVVFKDRLFIASNLMVYELVDGSLEPVPIRHSRNTSK